ncbi:MAG: sigma-70 family RNA polymerase sigma factor [Myxococcota bacterium]
MTGDSDLLDAWRAGDSHAGQELFKRYYDLIARFFANKITGSTSDLVQETFMACVDGRDRIRGDGQFRGYLFGVAYNVLKGHLRRQYRVPDELGSISMLDLDPGPSTIVGESEQASLLLIALRSLPVELQMIIELRYWEQMTSTDIAEILGIAPVTVRGRLRQGRIQLERAMREQSAPATVIDSAVGELERWVREVREQLPGMSS